MIDLGGFVPDNPTRLSSALHESGHCVVALALRRKIFSVEIGENGGGFFLQVKQDGVERDWSDVCRDMKVAKIDPAAPFILDAATIDMAGMAAQQHYCGADTRLSVSGGRDLRDLSTMLAAVCVCKDQEHFLRAQAIDRAVDLVSKHLPIIVALARRLYDARRLDRDEILATVRSTPGGPRLLGDPKPEPEMLYRYGVVTTDARYGRAEFASALELRQAIAEQFEPGGSEMRYRIGTLRLAG